MKQTFQIIPRWCCMCNGYEVHKAKADKPRNLLGGAFAKP